jgi:sugar phosphate isomerase/epimerase
MDMTRRALLAGMAAGIPLARGQETPAKPPAGFRRENGSQPRSTPPICLYTDQLPPEIGYEEMGGLLKTLGFDGADLMVQPGGHIAPEHADLNFERAIEAFNGSGIDVFSVSTSFTSPMDPTVRLAMQWGGEMGVRCFRPGHWRYGAAEVEQTMGEAQRDIAGFTNIARAVNQTVALHNAPDCVGASLFDTNMIIRGMDPHLVGYDFDAGYAAAQGGPGGFVTALKLALPRLKMVTARDCYYSKESGAWKLAECPLGEGMVDWHQFFLTLAQAKFTGPISLQLGYGGKDNLPAIRKDLAFLRKQRDLAYGG